jgi:hypothetical protein
MYDINISYNMLNSKKGGNKNNNGGADQIVTDEEKSLANVLFITNKISTQPNTDPAYKEEGILHITKTDGVSAFRQDITNFLNTFGHKGIDNPIFDSLRNKLLTKIENKIPIIENSLKADVKICNLRMDINIDQLLIIMTAYATVVAKPKTVNKSDETLPVTPPPVVSASTLQPPANQIMSKGGRRNRNRLN